MLVRTQKHESTFSNFSEQGKTRNVNRYRPEDLTIALCTIGRPGYLPAAIESLLATTPREVTIHLVLNQVAPEVASEAEHLLESWQGPVKVTRVPQRVEIWESHNLPLFDAETKLITFMGDDDLVLEPRIERLLTFFELEPEPVVVSSFARRTGGTPSQPVFLGRKDLGPTSIDEWEQWRSENRLFELCFPSAIFNVDAARAAGGFEAKFGPVMDVGLLTRLAQDSPIITDVRRTFGYRIHDQSLSTSDGAHLAELMRYVRACMERVRAGEPEPSIEEMLESEKSDPFLRRAMRSRDVASQINFRRAGAAVLGGRRSAGVSQLAMSAFNSPRVFAGKVRDQFGKHHGHEPVTPVARRDEEWVHDIDRRVAALPLDAPVATILIKGLYNYRVSFYQHLRGMLAERGVRLRLVHGQGTHEDRAKGDVTRLSWSEHLPLRTVNIRSQELLWQSGIGVARDSDIIVCEQASRLLLNYVLLFGRKLFGCRLALWGHGRNLRRGQESPVGETAKRLLTNRADWFFAYNRMSAAEVRRLGFPSERITAVQNATDTRELREARAAVTDADIAELRAELGATGDNIGLFIGGLYDLKRPDYLIAAAYELRRMVPDFELIVLGDGPMSDVVRQAAATESWVHYPGSVFSDSRATYGALAKIFLIPGLVGLNVVDAFALDLPIASVDRPYHAPEIEYVLDGVNAVMLAEDTTPTKYAQEVAQLLEDPERLARLRKGCRDSADTLTIEEMARRFADGVVEALR